MYGSGSAGGVYGYGATYGVAGVGATGASFSASQYGGYFNGASADVFCAHGDAASNAFAFGQSFVNAGGFSPTTVGICVTAMGGANYYLVLYTPD
jgi:hypothetical protein